MDKNNKRIRIVLLRSSTDLETNRSGGAKYQKMVIDALSKIYDVKVIYVSYREIMNDGTVKRLMNAIKMIMRIRNASKIDADIFLLERITMFFFKRYPKKKYIGICHHHWIPNKLHIIKKLFLLLSTRIGIRKVDILIAVSKYWKDYFESIGAKDVRVIYNAFEVEEFSDEKLELFKNKHNLNRDIPIIYIGNNSKEKGVVGVYEKLKDKDYLLVTSGLKKTDIPVLHFDLPFIDYLRLLAVSSLTVAMSQLPEGWCRTAHESMLCKTPVIGTGIAGMAELLEDGRQIVCKDINDLDSIVANLLNDKERMKNMALKGYLFAKRFTKEQFSKEWINLIESLE